MAGYLVDLTTGSTLASEAAINPQISCGDDVITRLAYARPKHENALLLRNKIVGALNLLIRELCRKADNSRTDWIHKIAVVCNKAMHHLRTNADVASLSSASFAPSTNPEVVLKAADLKIEASPVAEVYIYPPVAGFVGSDQVATLLAVAALEIPEPFLAIDIGTNTEISLIAHGQVSSVSCASGGAIEGTNISCGMHAVEAAMDHVKISGPSFEYHTIHGAAPIGICGSGLCDALAELAVNGIMDAGGRLQKDHPSVREGKNGREFVIYEGKTPKDINLAIRQDDIRAFQLANTAELV
jgi:uncharacterized 2Fe-2S/4Fe-4S cluster protein (DUF4445 family)